MRGVVFGGGIGLAWWSGSFWRCAGGGVLPCSCCCSRDWRRLRSHRLICLSPVVGSLSCDGPGLGVVVFACCGESPWVDCTVPGCCPCWLCGLIERCLIVAVDGAVVAAFAFCVTRMLVENGREGPAV